jgi:hypothetical protein
VFEDDKKKDILSDMRLGLRDLVIRDEKKEIWDKIVREQ